jgi:hypothetical protein
MDITALIDNLQSAVVEIFLQSCRCNETLCVHKPQLCLIFVSFVYSSSFLILLDMLSQPVRFSCKWGAFLSLLGPCLFALVVCYSMFFLLIVYAFLFFPFSFLYIFPPSM